MVIAAAQLTTRPAFMKGHLRRRFVALLCAAVIMAASTQAAEVAPVPQTGAAVSASSSIAPIEQVLAAQGYSVAALEQLFVRRIKAIDERGPALHSILEINPDAAASAAKLDRQRAQKKGAGAAAGAGKPLFGVPIVLKDNIDTADAMHTTAGSLALLDSRPARDAFIVRRLRAAGALILGKSNMSEWANFRSLHSSSGWSARGGQTRNPYDPARNPCGSSSGSAVAVAAELATVAVGTETDGSIICPASVNGLVGIKPTVGLVSRSGIIPVSASQDTAGPLARTVADAAALLTVLAGFDPDDPATARLKDQPPPNFLQALCADSLKGARVGVLRQYAGFNGEVDVLFEQALQTLRTLGAVVIDPVKLPTQSRFEPAEQIVLLYEFKDGINRYLASRSGAPKDLAALIAFNQAHRAQELPYFGQELFIAAEQAGTLNEPEYLQAHEQARRLAGPEGIDAALAKDQLDVLVAPSAGPAWTIDLHDGDHMVGGGIADPAAVAGYPHVTVPMGAVQGLPVGLSFVGTAWSDARLIGYAYAFEQATHARRAPAIAHLSN
jgi:amidase